MPEPKRSWIIWALPSLLVALLLAFHGVQNSRLNEVEAVSAKAETHMGRYEPAIDELKQDVKDIRKEVGEHGKKLERVETKTDMILDELRRMNGN